MAVSRMLYAGALLVCALSYLTWGQWLSWVLLWCLAALPWVSLLLSLRAVSAFQAEPAGPGRVTVGQWGELSLLGSCPYPVPPFRGRLRLQNLLTGERRLYRPEEGIPTRHCGGIRVTVEKGRVCDYLGLFSFPIRSLEEGFLLVLPRPVPMDPLPELPDRPGEPADPEPQTYRPGEPVRRIHRKLTLRTGSLYLLPAGTRPQPVELEFTLSAAPEEQTRLLGELLWLGDRLLRQGQPFLLRSGSLFLPVEDPFQLEKAMERLLCPFRRKDGTHG